MLGAECHAGHATRSDLVVWTLQFPFGASLARPSVAQELAAQVIGVNSFELPGEPSGVDREIIGQLPSGFCVATRKSIPRLISGRSAV